jgi:branched-chain amino acid transport system ATP-binding protein
VCENNEKVRISPIVAMFSFDGRGGTGLMHAATLIIRDEHRSLSAVLHGLLFLVGEIREGRQTPDHSLIAAMLRYIVLFPERLHHPKEDQFLFPALRERESSMASLIDELEKEHADGAPAVVRLIAAAEAYERDGDPAFGAFEAQVASYSDFQWSHMRKEEEGILPRAEAVLTPEDWQDIDAAFQSNTDPIGGMEAGREFRELFRRIANLAPPPIGVGPSREKKD